MTALKFLSTIAAVMGLGWVTSAPGQTVPVMEVIAEPTVRTREMGGVPLPSKDELEKMHRSQLHPACEQRQDDARGCREGTAAP